jgi:transposase-like protein
MLTVVHDVDESNDNTGSGRSLLDEIVRDGARQMLAAALQANALAALPKSVHPGAVAAMKEIYNAEDIDKAQLAVKAFEVDFGAKYPKAVAKIVDNADVLLEFYRYPAEHWIHLRTTNPIESTFGTVRLRAEVTKGPGSRAAGLAMAYKLIDAAHARWRAVNAPHLVALVRAGAVFDKGKLLERPIDITSQPSAAAPENAGSEVA